jgi:hypothetical protein
MKRKRFLQQVSLGTFTLLAAFNFINVQNTNSTRQKAEPLHADLVKEFVVAGHNDLEKVKAMVKKTPNIL